MRKTRLLNDKTSVAHSSKSSSLKSLFTFLKLSLVTLTMVLFGTVVASAAPTVNGLFYGDGDENDYYLYATSEHNSKLYIHVDSNNILSVALVVDRSVNDNVFLLKNHQTESEYMTDVGWGTNRPASKLVDSEFAEFNIQCGNVDLTWQQGYADLDDTTGLWYSDNTGRAGSGTIPATYDSSSSFAWNINTWNAASTKLWNLHRDGSDSKMWISPYDVGHTNSNGVITPNGLEGYPVPTGPEVYDGPPITFSETYQYEWPMVYEWSIDLADTCGSDPITALSGRSHHSPLKNGDPDENDEFLNGTDPEPFTDYSDLPDIYGPLKEDDGARHVILVGAPYLGSIKPDAELDAAASTDADGDDNNGISDEDGITFYSPVVAGGTSTLGVEASVECDTQTCNFSAWMDFNNDGDFDDADEQVFADTVVPGGDTNLTYSVPADTDASQPLYTLFRLTTDTGITSKGAANDGEVEAYKIVPSSLPVTIAYVYPQKTGSYLDIAFSTATEVGNVGFNIYAVKGKKWTKLNDELILGALDSFKPQDYQVTLRIPDDLKFKEIGIAGVDVNGDEDRHGAFKIGHESGSKAVVVPIDWKKVNKQVKADKKARKAAKKAARKVTKVALKDQMINLSVSEDAVYRVTHDDLLAAGINLNGQKAEKIAISFRGEGVARHIEGLDKKGKWTTDSVIEFMGTAPIGSDALYLDANQYQLSLAKALVVNSKGIEPITVKQLVFETNKRYGQASPGDDPFYDATFYAKGSREGKLTRQFNIPKLGETKTEMTVYVSKVSKTNHHLLIAVNGNEVADLMGDDEREEWVIKITVDNTIFHEGDNEITLRAVGESDDYEVLTYDKLVISYDDGEPVASRSPAITLSDKVKERNINPKKGTNYVIISHPLFMGETLDRYINERESEGWKIQLVNVEDIYAAYGYGMATPDAIKAYLNIVANEGVTHVQLVGASSYDYHDYLGLGSISFIPSLYVTTEKVITYTPSDIPLVTNDEGIPQMAIGRWPVRTLEGLEAIVNKSLSWKSSGQSASHTALFIADKNDGNANFGKQMEFIVQKFETEAKWDNITRVYLDEMIEKNNGDMAGAVGEARDSILESLNQGPSITSYSGHAAPSNWSVDGLLKESDISPIQNYENSTMVLPLACYTTYADSPSVNTLAHQLLVADKNGAVLIYGATMFSSYAANGVIASKVIDHLFDGDTIGEAVMKSKKALGEGYRDTILNGSLLGDVTLRLR